MFRTGRCCTGPIPSIVQAAGNGASSNSSTTRDSTLTVANHDDTAAALAQATRCSVQSRPSHGDRELPEISANGTSDVRRPDRGRHEHGGAGGTGCTAPDAAGEADTLESWPEAAVPSCSHQPARTSRQHVVVRPCRQRRRQGWLRRTRRAGGCAYRSRENARKRGQHVTRLGCGHRCAALTSESNRETTFRIR